MTDFQKKLKKLYGAVPDEVRQRIADGIEKNRKRSAELHFSSPDGKPENIVHFECDLEQHDFLFGFGLFPLCELHGEQLKNWQDICCKLFNLGITPLCGVNMSRREEWSGIQLVRFTVSAVRQRMTHSLSVGNLV